MEIEGIVHLIGETQVVGSAGTFKKRTIVIATNEQYIQYIPIDFVQDKTDILDKYSKGQEVKISVNVRGNEYQGKYYVSLNGWKVEKTADAPASEFAPKMGALLPGEEPDDLPFG